MNEHFNKGYRQAERVAAKEPGAVAYWLARARRGRRKWKTRLFNWKKRRFLDGFINCLERHQKNLGFSLTPEANVGAGPYGSDIEIEMTENVWTEIGFEDTADP